MLLDVQQGHGSSNAAGALLFGDRRLEVGRVDVEGAEALATEAHLEYVNVWEGLNGPGHAVVAAA
eukprot:2111664-Alexandrium_andersonii.AAC.1